MIKRIGLAKHTDIKIMSVWLKLYQGLYKLMLAITSPFRDSVHNNIRYPSLAKRFGAWFLDVIFVATVAFVIVSALGPWISKRDDSVIESFTVILLNVTVIVGYFIIASSVWRKTLGKFMFGVGVMSKQKNNQEIAYASWLQGAAREVFKVGILVFIPILIPICIILAMTNKPRRFVWDYLSGTVIGYVDRID